ncbi:hypothetical protein NB688_001037 [Xanthomonas sacchari]|uniref:GmrSD restriction endonucleases N-terminal domain-containing protein n=1 Tax=Xanthomonas sacchari TaxID=56458 RepID=A0ABT3DQ29_9XANT|nr:DUF262 domain-containing protein [Xanthomonas sacchari]MCW0397614.1 hypothetical protein [Xanthomonas sacchari]MCW0418871.1 hypothetical protein [Xanthomonas sacchari]UYK71788.1 DUF262 domain-containing protein [Xanthomonas sacchari]
MIAEEQIERLENQITEEKKTVDFDTREFTIEFLVQKYISKIEINENDIFVPDYQREFVWDTERQSKLIESITLGLPIPIIFVAEDKNGRLEIVDGSQRIRTIAAFITGALTLEGLEKLTEMNGLNFQDLPASRKRKINNTAIRMIVLSDAANEEVRNDLFERINRGSDLLRNMEKRKGIYHGPFNDFIYKKCAKNPDLAPLSPLAKSVEKRQEHEELVLRFFAFANHYPHYSRYHRGVSDALDSYMGETNQSFNEKIEAEMLLAYESMLHYVKNCFPHGFTRGSGKYVSRTLFEAISVGVHLALKQNPNLPQREIDIERWLINRNFSSSVYGERQTHNPQKILTRINYVRDELLRTS